MTKQYIVKMDGMPVRLFSVANKNDFLVMTKWAKKHCRSGKVEIVKLTNCGRLPRACGKLYPNLEMKGLVYKPFVDVGLREVGRAVAR